MSGFADAADAIATGFRPGVRIVDRDDAIAVVGPRGATIIRPVTEAIRDACRSMLLAPRGERELETSILAADGVAGLSAWYFYLRRLRSASLVRYVVSEDGSELLVAAAMVDGRDLRPCPVDDAAAYRLSRFAYCRMRDGALVVATPLSVIEVTLTTPAAAALLATLSRPATVDDLAAVASFGAAALRGCIALMLAARTIGVVTAERLDEDRDSALRQWEFHDLLFHTRSRLGRHDHPAGGTFRFRSDLPPAPATRESYPSKPIPLERPPQRGGTGMSLYAAMEARRSVRRHGREPLTIEQLGWFLFRCARIDAVLPPDASRRRPYEISRRPYPSGGATYDLELYLTVAACDGLAPGVYHYDGREHALRLVSPPCAETDALLDGARIAAKMDIRPQTLVTLTSRFQRLSWKYETIAYAAVLKNVGVMFHNMYLVATEMGLAPCALGSGNTDMFGRLIGGDFYAEGAVGEFMLGSR